MRSGLLLKPLITKDDPASCSSARIMRSGSSYVFLTIRVRGFLLHNICGVAPIIFMNQPIHSISGLYKTTDVYLYPTDSKK